MQKKITKISGTGFPCLKVRYLKSFIILMALFYCLHANAQHAPAFTIHIVNAPLTRVFDLIEQQSNYRVMYLEKYLRASKLVTLKVTSAGINEVLEKSFYQQDLSYQVDGQNILISQKGNQAPQKGISSVQSFPKDTILISGRVSGEGKPLVGASVKAEGTTEGKTTDENGRFYNLRGSASSGYITVTFMGFYPKRVKLPQQDSRSLDIELERSSTDLKGIEVVNTGYQAIAKERATGSFSMPEKTMFESRVSTDVMSKLEGITPGVVFNRGDLGATESSIKIRGQSTIYANDAVLVVVDGFPYDGNVNNITPNDVENITVLKDAAAASIWGVRAGNGVIVITTKRGKLNQPMKISVNANTTIFQRPNLNYDRNFLRSSDFIEVERNLFDHGFYDDRLNDPTFAVVSPMVELLSKFRDGSIGKGQLDREIKQFEGNDVRDELQKYFYRNGIAQQYNISASGGGKGATYYLSGGYDRNLGSQTGYDYSRLKFISQNTFRPIEALEISLGIDYTQTLNHSDNALNGLITGGGYNTIYPYAKFTGAQGQPAAIAKDYRSAFTDHAQQQGLLDWTYVPVLEKGQYTTAVKNADTRISAGIRYTLAKGWSVEFKSQIEKGNTSSVSLASAKSYYARNLVNMFSTVADGQLSFRAIPNGAIRSNRNNIFSSTNLRGQLNYSAVINSHEISALAGVEQREQTTEGSTANLYGYDPLTGNSSVVDYVTYRTLYPTGNFAQIPNNTSVSGTVNRFRSYFTNMSYIYGQRYTVSVSGRVDASNYFGVATNKKMVPLWSSGLKWDIDQEDFFSSKLLSMLKLRATYGYSGNLASNLAAVTTFRYDGTSFLNGSNVATIANIPNSNLRWEKTGMLNIGLDFSFIGTQVTGSIEYFRKKGIDLIGDAIIDPTAGVNQLTGNFAGMKGQGIDLQLNAVLVDKIFKWRSNLNFSFVSDKVTTYALSVPAYQSIGGGITPIIGRPVYGMYSYRWAGLDPLTGDPMGYQGKELSKDYGALLTPKEEKDLVYNGPARPSYYGGWTNTISYHGISLSANINFKLGYYFRRSTISYYTLYYSWKGNIDLTERWKSPGDEKKTTVPSMNYPADQNRDNFYAGSQANIEKGDHIRLQDISISYDLKGVLKASRSIKSLTVYGYLNNVGILWKANKKGIDPDYPLGGIPPARTISLGLKAQF